MEAIRRMEPAWEKVQGLKFELSSRIYNLPNGGTKVVPLVFVAGCYDKWMVAVYEKAYERFLATLSSSEKAQNGGDTRY